MGKNKVMTIALGKGPTDEYKDNLHKVCQMLLMNITNIHHLFIDSDKHAVDIIECIGKTQMHECKTK